jgi:copper chaperone for superoxide dismutase
MRPPINPQTHSSNRKRIGAAVCILETHSTKVAEQVRGLVRMVQVAANMTILDVSIRGLSPGTYTASIRENGDISRGPESTGRIWDSVSASTPTASPAKESRGVLGTLTIPNSGIGSIFLDKPIQIWELIGRSIVVSKEGNEKLDKEDPDTLVGVIARSAGVWDNDKTVCSCSGKTVWEERKEQADRGML